MGGMVSTIGAIGSNNSMDGALGGLGGFAENLTGIDLGDNSSADHARRAQQQATDRANGLQREMYDQTRADNTPWREAGGRALTQMENADFQKDFTMADFQADPGYAFRMAEGQKAIERSAAARGGRHGTATMKALSDYGQNTASAEYGNAYNRFNADRDRRFSRLGSIAGVGQATNALSQQSGQNYANQVGNNLTGMGNATAAMNIQQGNRQQQFFHDQPVELVGQFMGGGGAAMFSDERLKENIVPVSHDELKEMKAHLKAYRFNYKDQNHGVGDFVGVMAQDLQKSELGKTLVQEDSEGRLHLDMQRILMLFLATMAEG